MNKPELLLPVGNPEMFYAAVEGGADAVYLGLRQFNARGRASNFTIYQLQSLLKIAAEKQVKVYITLNTVIKNNELPDLLDILYMLNQTQITALIIQDWGVLHLVKKLFPSMEVHASTQMANHNSLGVNYSQQKGFERVVMARELTLTELKEIRKKSNLELEIFVHGALCYSFSGICLFSSFLGGNGANRGFCTQPCRRFYQINEKNSYVFSLKDNQAIDLLPELMKIGIASLKVEGRLKPAEYVHRVSEAYKETINNTKNIDGAKESLKYDMGREKTAYFLGENVSNTFTDNPNTGIFIGTVTTIKNDGFNITSSHQLKSGNRLRIRSADDELRKAIKVRDFKDINNNEYFIPNTEIKPQKGDQVFLASLQEVKFPNKFREEGKPVKNHMPSKEKNNILKSIGSSKKPNVEQIYIRIDSLNWLRKIRLEDVDGLMLNLPRKEWADLKTDTPFIQKNIRKFIVELPKFIQEKDVMFYETLCENLSQKGIKNFIISHLSQKLIMPPKSRIATNENVYLFNDAAIDFIRQEKINLYTYPLENDLENLLAGKDRYGIVPMYFYPHLFYSRMPIKLDSQKTSLLCDSKNDKFRHVVRDGLTLIIPEHPVALMQYKSKLQKAGFNKYLIDLSHEKPSSNTVKRLLNRLRNSEQIQPASNFNFKKGLK